MIEALIAGERDPEVLADLARLSLRAKRAALEQALVGRFNDHHVFLARLHLDLIDDLSVKIDTLDQRIEKVIEPLRSFRDLICSIPGVSTRAATMITAEIGDDITRFATPAALASWAGVTPGTNESAGKTKSTRTRHGTTYLKGALGIVALNIARHDGTFLHAKYRRIATRRGPMKAFVAIGAFSKK